MQYGPADQEDPNKKLRHETEMETVEQEASRLESLQLQVPNLKQIVQVKNRVEAETDISEPALTPQEPVTRTKPKLANRNRVRHRRRKRGQLIHQKHRNPLRMFQSKSWRIFRCTYTGTKHDRNGQRVRWFR